MCQMQYVCVSRVEERLDRWMECVYQHAQGGKRLQEAGCRPEQGEAEAEESQSMQQIKTHANTGQHPDINDAEQAA